MSTRNFLILISIVIAGMLASLAYERYQNCQTKGGVHCQVGPWKKP